MVGLENLFEMQVFQHVVPPKAFTNFCGTGSLPSQLLLPA